MAFSAAVLLPVLGTMVAGLLSLRSFVSSASFRRSLPEMGSTAFFGSQVGGRSVISYSYTDLPWKLLAYDLYYFFNFAWALPYILLPLSPAESGDLDELSFTPQNVFCIVVHFVLCILQLAFIVCLPLAILLPVWIDGIAMGAFFLVNAGLCRLLNGRAITYWSDPKYAPELPEHSHEQWIFLNGVAVGQHWLKGNLNRLAVTFKRPVLGVHNRTSGIIFDVLECLIQRNMSYATSDVRMCYRIIKEKLYNPQYSKVVFILHSQGGIEGGLVLDWLLQELPQDLLAKLEVYTFGNAANHFNNPHRHLDTQIQALKHPFAASTDSTKTTNGRLTTSNNHSGLTQLPRADHRQPTAPTLPTNPPLPTNSSLTAETSSSSPSVISDRAIGHIEHYAHTTDFVALWGVLHFATSAPSSHSMPRFIGRVFARTSERGGHQFCQHYLDGMFPLAHDANTGKLACDPRTGAFVGCAETGNEFMESEIVVGSEGDEATDEREAMATSWMGSGCDVEEAERQVELHDTSPVTPVSLTQRGRFRTREGGQKGLGAKVKVKELSRLWKYRNGRSPVEKPPLLERDADGVVRNATM